MNDRRPEPDDNPFRAHSPRNVLARARERVQLIRHWLNRHDFRELDNLKPGQSPVRPDEDAD